MIETRETRRGPGARLRDTVLVAGGYAVLALAMLFASRAVGGVAMLWVGNGLLLGALLRRGGEDAAWWLLACLLVDAGVRMAWAGVLAGAAPMVASWSLAAALAVADIAEVALAWWLLRRLRAESGHAASQRVMVGTITAAIVVAPALGAALAAAALQQFTMAPLRASGMAWWIGHLLGLLALAPLLVAALLAQRDAAFAQARLAGQRLQAIADHAPGLVAQLGRDLRFRFANRGYLQWHGLREEQVVGRAPREIFDPTLAARLDSRMTRVLAGQAQQFDLVMADGRELRTRYQPQFDADGSVDGFYLLAEDVSWRGQGTRRFEALLAAADALVIVDADGRIVQANAAAARLFEREPAALLQLPVADLIGEGACAALEDALQRARQPWPGEALPPDATEPLLLQGRRGNDEFPMQLRLVQLTDADGTSVAISLRDIGVQTRLEHALQHQQALARTTLDAIGDAVIACDGQWNIVAFNPVAEALTGWPRDEACALPLQQVVRLLGQESGAALPSPLELALRDNRDVHLQPDAVLLRRDGERMPVEASATPVRDAAGRAIGAVMAFHDLSETRATARKMSHLAQHDYLTDLPNRVLLHDRLSQALAASERGSKGALLFVDLDFFKKINDTLGHQAGDKVLQEVARRLVDAVRTDDTVSRQGGDEFVLLLVRLADPRDAARVAEKLILAVEEPFHVEGQVLHISASVGIALFPQDARDSKTLMKQADTALYHAKEAGRGRYSYFTGVMSERADQRMRIEHDLRFALANEDFFLAYQPKVLQPEGRITGMEALVRWRRSDTGEIVAPDEFIPVAEETGLITALDDWVLHEACRQNRAWQDAGLPAVAVAVNVSLARFDPERLLAQVRKTLAATGMAPQWLEIEFTESQMFTHLERAQELIAQLKALGVQVAMDDFGTGYSSLGYLVRYKFDALKIDRSFVQGLPDDPKHSAIVKAIVGMARALDYRVVAEGVEEQAQADALLAHGCREMQGYLYSRPLPAADFAVLLQRGSIVAPAYAAALSRQA